MESRGLKVPCIDRDEEEEEGAILMVRVIRVEVERVHFECSSVNFVGVALCVWIYLFESRQPAGTQNPTQPKNPRDIGRTVRTSQTSDLFRQL